MRITGCCNIIKRTEEGRLIGKLGDGEGFVRGLHFQGQSIKGKSVYLAGAGSAATAMAFALAGSGARHITVSNRTLEKAARLAKAVSQKYPFVGVDVDGDIAGHDVVVNGTSLGMFDGDPLPIDVSKLRAGTLVAEVIGTPDKTPLLIEAEKRGCSIHYGRNILAGQLELIFDFLLDQNYRINNSAFAL